MTFLPGEDRLRWVLRLSSVGGYSTWQLEDDSGLRSGWIVNAGRYGWTAHIGPWSDADAEPQWLADCHLLDSFMLLSDAKNWVEENLAELWSADQQPNENTRWVRGRAL